MPMVFLLRVIESFYLLYTAILMLKAIPLIGMDERYPITKDWRYLVEQVIADIEYQFPKQQVIGLRTFFWLFSHSDGGLINVQICFHN